MGLRECQYGQRPRARGGRRVAGTVRTTDDEPNLAEPSLRRAQHVRIVSAAGREAPPVEVAWETEQGNGMNAGIVVASPTTEKEIDGQVELLVTEAYDRSTASAARKQSQYLLPKMHASEGSSLEEGLRPVLAGR